jgi:hypothetical protein
MATVHPTHATPLKSRNSNTTCCCCGVPCAERTHGQPAASPPHTHHTAAHTSGSLLNLRHPTPGVGCPTKSFNPNAAVQHLQNHCCPSQPLVHLEHVASCELGHHPAQRRYVRPDGHCQSRHGQQHSGGGPRTRSGTCHKQVSAGRGASSPHRRPLGGALDLVYWWQGHAQACSMWQATISAT